MGDGKTNSQLMDVILMVHCNCLMLRRTTTRSPQLAGSTEMPFGEEAMKNHCAYCHGKFGLVRHRRAFKSFCSQTCVDHYRTWLRGEVRKRKSWSDCIWSASLNVIPYSGESSSAQQRATIARADERTKRSRLHCEGLRRGCAKARGARSLRCRR